MPQSLIAPSATKRTGYLPLDMLRLRGFLFSTGTRFGLTIGCFGAALIFVSIIVGLLYPYHPASSGLLGIGIIMFWSGFPWAVLTAYLKPSPLNGFGITFAVLFFLIVPAVERSNHIVSPMVWACALWIIVCLVVLVVVLANLYHDATRRAPPR